MLKVPIFRIFGQDNPKIINEIQPNLDLRSWSDLSESEKGIALQELKNRSWAEESDEVLAAIQDLNDNFLRLCPGKELHKTKPEPSPYPHSRYGNERAMRAAALSDFRRIFLTEESGSVVFRMLTVLAKNYIDTYALSRAKDTEDKEEREIEISSAFERFDQLANCLNHIFRQFSVNVTLTRSGLVPVQDHKIIEAVYVPTLDALSDPRWTTVSDKLAVMFDAFKQGKYDDTITHGHAAIQSFLQTLTGKEKGKNSKGELAALFKIAKNESLIPTDRFTDPIIKVLQGYFASERATKSSAKPAVKLATFSDALLFMNIVMVFIQHCLTKEGAGDT